MAPAPQTSGAMRRGNGRFSTTSKELNELYAQRNSATTRSPIQQGVITDAKRKRWKRAEMHLNHEAAEAARTAPAACSSDWLLGIFEPSGPRPTDREVGVTQFEPPERKTKPLPRTRAGYGNPKQERCGELAVWYSNNLPGAKQRGSDAARLTAEGKTGRLTEKVYRPTDSWTGANVDPVYQPGVHPCTQKAKVDPKVLSPSSRAEVSEGLLAGNWGRPAGAPEHLSLEMALATQKHPRKDWRAYCDGRPPWKGWGQSVGAFSMDEVIKRGILHDPVWEMECVRYRGRPHWQGSASVGALGKWAAQPAKAPEPWMDRHPYRGANAPEDEEERLVKIFNLMDLDGSGAINGDELAQSMGLMGLKFTGNAKNLILKEIDQDNSGEIDLEEFLTFFRKIKGPTVTKGSKEERDLSHGHLPVIGMWARTFSKNDWRQKESRHVTLTGPGTAIAPVHARMRSGSPTRWPGWPKPPWKGWGANYGIFSMDEIIKRGILHTRAGTGSAFLSKKKKTKSTSEKSAPGEPMPLGVTASAFYAAEEERETLGKLRDAGVLGNYNFINKVMTGEIQNKMSDIMDDNPNFVVDLQEIVNSNFRRLMPQTTREVRPY